MCLRIRGKSVRRWSHRSSNGHSTIYIYILYLYASLEPMPMPIPQSLRLHQFSFNESFWSCRRSQCVRTYKRNRENKPKEKNNRQITKKIMESSSSDARGLPRIPQFIFWHLIALIAQNSYIHSNILCWLLTGFVIMCASRPLSHLLLRSAECLRLVLSVCDDDRALRSDWVKENCVDCNFHVTYPRSNWYFRLLDLGCIILCGYCGAHSVSDPPIFVSLSNILLISCNKYPEPENSNNNSKQNNNCFARIFMWLLCKAGAGAAVAVCCVCQ